MTSATPMTDKLFGWDKKPAARYVVPPTLGDLLRTWRHHERIGVRDAAKTIGLSAATLSRIENGKPVGADVMLKLINRLFGGKT